MMSIKKKLDIYLFILISFIILIINYKYTNTTNTTKHQNNKILKSIFLKKNKFFLLENEFIRLKISNIGGHISELELKNYKAYNTTNNNYDKNLFLIKNYSSIHRLINNNIDTTFLIFKHKYKNIKNGKKLILTTTLPNKVKLIYIYIIYNNNYYIDFFIKSKNFYKKSNKIIFNWNQLIFSVEKEKNYENNFSNLYYNNNNSLTFLSEKNFNKKLINNCNWIANKQQFFTSILSLDNKYNNVIIESTTKKFNNVLKEFNIKIPLIKNNYDLNFNIKWFFCPLDFKILKSLNNINHNNYENIIPFGYGIIKLINKYFFLLIFYILEYTKLNYGLIIILMTIIVKIIFLPITYKQLLINTIISIINPKIKEINEKFNDDPIKKNKAIIELYKKFGINPILSFISIFLQIPIFYALFKFFSTIINLRGQQFLWSNDLTSYDSIFKLPFKIPIYGNHISLFSLLYIIALLIYTKISTTNNNNKYIQYIMIIIMLLFINNYSSALSLYYFILNIFNIIFYFLIKKFFFKKIHNLTKTINQ